jgi:AcrR family transcriptional regulator
MEDKVSNSTQHKTKRQLIFAFEMIITQGNKTLNRITIRQLTKLAKVHRITFYQYFANMTDFIKWYLHKDLIFQVGQNKILLLEDALRIIYAFIHHKREILKAIFTSKYAPSSKAFIVEEAYTYQLTNFERIDTNHLISNRERKIYAKFYGEGITFLIIDYILNEETQKFTQEEYINISMILVKNYIERILDTFQTNPKPNIFL